MKNVLLSLFLCLFSPAILEALNTQGYTFNKSTLGFSTSTSSTVHPTVMKLSPLGANKYGLSSPLTNNEGVALGVSTTQYLYPNILQSAAPSDKITLTVTINDAKNGTLNLGGPSGSSTVPLQSTDGVSYKAVVTY